MTRTWRALAFVIFVIAVSVTVAAPMAAYAQVWELGGFSGDADARCLADGDVTLAPPPVVVDPPPFPLSPGLFGRDLGTVNQAGCKDDFSSCHTSAYGGAQMFVDGIGTRCLVIRWDSIAQAQRSCPCPPAPKSYDGEGEGSLSATMTFVPAGLPAGTPVTVFWRWRQVTTNNYDNPDGPPDFSRAQFGTLTLGGMDLFNGDFDMVNVRGWVSRSNSGDFPSTIGTPIGVAKAFSLDVNMEPLPEVACPGLFEDDGDLVSYGGDLWVCLDGPPPPPQDPNGRIEFSVDMGSDASLVDVPDFEGNEVFDPGDMYLLFDTVALPPMGADGLKDDHTITPTEVSDPRPDAPGAPITDACSGMDVGTQQGFNLDVDGSDTLDSATAAMLESALAAGPLAAPISMAPTECVRRADYLLISYDDDRPTHVYDPICRAPAADGSPIGETYGSSANQDEVVGLNLLAGPPPVAGVPFPVANEGTSHISMAPDPVRVIPTSPPNQLNDDDVDALDETRNACDTWLFSPDHEARIGRLAANIYRVTAAGDTPFVTSDHLGLFAGTDVRDFEFVVTTDPITGADWLTVLFTVAPDDPGTFGDESQGLDPGMIYASYLTGRFPPPRAYLAEPLPDAIDALTALPAPLPPAPCPDSDCDGVPNDIDCAPLDASIWATPGEVTGLLFSNATTLNWTAPAELGGIPASALYDVVRSTSKSDFATAAITSCVESTDGPNTTATDLVNPARGGAFYYLVRAENGCGTGPTGVSMAVRGCP
jgi:hypothetical protein